MTQEQASAIAIVPSASAAVPGAGEPPGIAPQWKYVKANRLVLRGNPRFDERWVQDRIAEDPSILGLGDVVLRDRERRQPAAGRLDLLLQDADSNHRYEVEIQLGSTDEAHIIRTVEYWDVERKRYPQYDHTAVIVAEDITSRFLNVISLFNGTLPLVALQMRALTIDDKVALVFTTVMNELQRGLVDEDEEAREAVDRAYWEKRAGKHMLSLTDELIDVVREFDPQLTPKYNRFYIGLARGGASARAPVSGRGRCCVRRPSVCTAPPSRFRLGGGRGAEADPPGITPRQR